MEASDNDHDEDWWRPPWETDSDEPPGAVKPRLPAAEPDYTHPLLAPLARAQDAVARLESRVATASPAVAEGLRARLSYREAAGWLDHAHVWVHPQDLALRDAGLTGSYGAASRLGRVEGELPATVAETADFAAGPAPLAMDVTVDMALRFAWLWRRLAEFRTWTPLADAAAMQETLQSLGIRSNAEEIGEWLASLHAREAHPALIRAGRGARAWINRGATADPMALDGMFLAVCLWREKGFGRAVSLPFWSAGESRIHRLSLKYGLAWMVEFLGCVAEAARIAGSELDRLLEVEAKGAALARTARSRLPDVLEAVLRMPIVTARSLAEKLRITPQAALALLRQLLVAGIVREATGRSSWRAFILS